MGKQASLKLLVLLKLVQSRARKKKRKGGNLPSGPGGKHELTGQRQFALEINTSVEMFIYLTGYMATAFCSRCIVKGRDVDDIHRHIFYWTIKWNFKYKIKLTPIN